MQNFAIAKYILIDNIIFIIKSTEIIVEKETGIAPIFTKPIHIAHSQDENKIVITCQVNGMPMPQVQWKIEDKRLVLNESMQSFYDENTGEVALTLNDISNINEQALYTVEVENIFGKAISKAEVVHVSNKTESIKLKVMKAPRVTPLKAQTLPNGAMLTLSSLYTGEPEPEIKWMKNGKEVPLDKDVRIMTKNGTSIFTIKNVDRKRAGKYEIVATNQVGESRASGSIMVSDEQMTDELLAPQFIDSIKPKTVLENEVVILEALVDSYPESSFQWFFNATQVQTNNIIRIHTQQNKSVLIIEKFTHENDGVYTCRAENVAGSVTSSATVKLVESETQLEEVKEYLSPRFIEKLKPLNLMDGESLHLLCRVTGYPTPKVVWLRNKHIFTEDKGIHIVQDANGYCELKMPEVFVEDAGIYACKAINKFGRATSKTNVIIEGIKQSFPLFYCCCCFGW